MKKKKESEGISLEDAFAGDDDVEYVKAKPRKIEKKIEDIPKRNKDVSEIQIKASKPISQINKGDKIKIDNLILEVDAHYVLIDHGTTKEMTIELFDQKTDKDYQIRYFNDQVETTLEFYELKEIIYNKVEIEKVEW